MTDPSSRLTPLAVMLLGLLSEDDMHPYEMIRLMRIRRDDRIVSVTNGTVYHTVARLLEHGLIAEVGVDRDGNRPERTTYTLTDSGAADARAWIRVELARVGKPDRFRVALAEAHNLERDEAVTLLDERRGILADQVAQLDDDHRRAIDKGVPVVFLLDLDREVQLRRAEQAWLDDLLGRISQASYPWGPHDRSSDRYLAQRKAARS